MMRLHGEIYPFSSALCAQLLPFSLDSFHIWLLLVFLQKYTLHKSEVRSDQKREIQHEGKAVENVSKATERVRKRERIKRIVSGGKKQRAQKHISRKRQKESRRNSRQEPGFSFFAGGKQRRACYKSISSSKYGTVPALQDDCRSVQPHCHCSTSSAR